jgi:hypothetical protein
VEGLKQRLDISADERSMSSAVKDE